LKDVMLAFSMSLLVFFIVVLIIIYQKEEYLNSNSVYKIEIK
jgi:hypothetical protein